MKVTFKDGKEIEFRQFGNIWLADSVIWEKAKHHGTFDELHALKAEIDKWFEENAPEEILSKYRARLPLRAEIEPLDFKDQIAYSEGKTDHVADYFLGDETDKFPVSCGIDVVKDVYFARFYCYTSHDWSVTDAVRLCLEEKE